MATWSPISNSVPQFSKNAGGAAAADYYLKFYLSGTTTPTSMATDSTGGTLLDKCKINSLGYPVNGSDEVFIPHIDQAYKLALYTNATDADNNATGSAAWVVDGLTFKTFSQDASNVTYTPAGTGAVATDVQTELRKSFIRVSNYGTNSSAVILADQAAYAAGLELLIDVDVDISDYGNDYIRFQANWRGLGSNSVTVTFKNIQWYNQSNVSVLHCGFLTDAPQTGGNISAYGGTNGFTTKSTNSGNIDFAAIDGLKFIGNKIENTTGTTNCIKTEACDNMVFELNESKGGAISWYGNKQHRCDAVFGISTANSRSNVVSLKARTNSVDGNNISKFDLMSVWGGVGGHIIGGELKNGLYDGLDLFTSGESLIVSGLTIFEVGHIGIQAKIDTSANDRDSIGAGSNRRLVISDNIIENVYPKDATSGSGVTDINGIMMLFSDDQGEITTPGNDDFIRHVICHDNIIVGVHDDNEHADPTVRITGISCDVFMSSIHHNIVTGVRRQPTQTTTNTGNAIAVNSVGVGPVNNVDINHNILSAQINGVYLNGTTTKPGDVNNIRFKGNELINDDTVSGQGMSNAGYFITPGCQDVTIDGGTIDVTGSCIILRRDFSDISIKNMDKMKATNHALQIEGYGVDLHFENCKCDPGQKKVNVVQGSDSNWDTQSRRWFFDNLKGDGDIDLDFATSAVGGIKEVFLDRCHFPGDSRFMLKGFDNSGGNGIKNRFRARNNDFDDMNGGLAIDLNRITKVKIANNHVDCGANTGQLVNFGSSVEDGVVNDNDGFTASALLVNTSSAVNVTDRDNVKI